TRQKRFARLCKGTRARTEESRTMSDTGAPKPLSAKHAAFVDAYMVSRSAVEAALASGYKARSAASLMALQPIRDEIRRRNAATATDTKTDLATLLRDAETARQIAADNGNASGMVAALKLKAELLGLMDGEAKPPVDPSSVPIRELVKVIAAMLLEQGYK